MVMIGTNIIYISLMIVSLIIKLTMTATTSNNSIGELVIKTIMHGFIALALIQSVAIVLTSTNIQISWQ